MNLTLQTWVTFFFLAIIMGLQNIYSTLLTGWGDGGSIVAVILCLVMLSKNQRNIINYNLGQTMISAGGSVGFTVAIVAAIYYTYSEEGAIWNPPLFDLSLLIAALSVMGVAIAAPLRRFVVHWFFPSAVACATILKAVTSENMKERLHARRLMGISGLISGVLTLPAKITLWPGSYALFTKIPLGSRLSLSIDPILYGIGIVIGPRIGTSMLLGGLCDAYLITPQVEAIGGDIGEYTRWIAVGLMTLPAFSSVIFALLFKTKRSIPPGFSPKNHKEDALNWKQWSLVGATFLLAMALATYEMNHLFSVSWVYVSFGALIAAPMVFALGKVASETDINPVRLLAITLLFLFSLFNQHSSVALLAIGVSGATFAAVAVDLFYDLRTGFLIRANPKHQIIVQFLAVVPTAFATVYFLNMLANNFAFGEGQYFPAPGVVIWATMAQAFSEGAGAVSPNVWFWTGVASVFGILLTVFENWKPTKPFAPSAFALGIALLLPFEMAAAIFVGSFFRLMVSTAGRWKGKEFKIKIEEGAFQSGSAIFAASSITGIIAVILITLGIAYLPVG